MGDVKHTATFIRSALVRDPYSLGDLLGPQDALRIQSEFPELFKPRAIVVPRVVTSDTVNANPALKHTKPASGSPYKTPVIPKTHTPVRLSHSQQISQPRQSFHSNGQRNLPKITIQPRNPFPLKQTSRISAPPKMVPMSKELAAKLSKSGPVNKPPSTMLRNQDPNLCPSRQQLSSHTVDLIRKPTIRFSTTVTTKSVSPTLNAHPQSKLLSVSPTSTTRITHQRMGEVHSPRKPILQPSPSILRPQKSEEVELVPKGQDFQEHDNPEASTRPTSNVTKKIMLPAPGFIRPVLSGQRFGRKKSRSLPATPVSRQKRMGVEGYDFGPSSARAVVAKYEEIHNGESVDLLEIMVPRQNSKVEKVERDFNVTSPCSSDEDAYNESLVYSVPGNEVSCSSLKSTDKRQIFKSEMHEIKELISENEQILFANLLASNYQEFGRLKKKLAGSKLEKSSTRSRETSDHDNKGFGIGGGEYTSTDLEFRITKKQKRVLEELARELIRVEIEQLRLEKNEQKIFDVAVGTQTETPTKSTSETLEFYREGVKEMIDAGTGISPIDTTISEPAHTPENAVLPKLLADASELSIETSDFLTPTKTDSVEKEKTQNKDSVSDNLFRGKVECHVEENRNYENKGGRSSPELEEKELPELEPEYRETPSNLVRELERLSTILEEAATAAEKKSGSILSPYFDPNENVKATVPGPVAVLSVRSPKSDRTKDPENNDITECSSISDFLFSDAKSPPKLEEMKVAIRDETSDPNYTPKTGRSMSLLSKMEKFLPCQQDPRDQLPQGLANQSISLLHLSFPEADPTDISESISSALPNVGARSVCKSSSISEESYQHIYTSVLSHGELLASSMSIGEVSWPAARSPGLEVAGECLQSDASHNSELNSD